MVSGVRCPLGADHLITHPAALLRRGSTQALRKPAQPIRPTKLRPLPNYGRRA